MRPAIKISDERLRKKMRKYEAVVGKEVKQLVYNASRLACVELAKVTNPMGLSQSARAQVELSIERDIRQIFTPLNPEWWKVAAKMNGGDEIKNPQTGIVFARGTQLRYSTVNEAKTFHRANRGRNGGTKRLTVGSRALIKQSTMRQLIRQMRKRAGIVKAGWGLCAMLCRADVRQPLHGIPAWVKRNIQNAKGSVDMSKASGLGWRVKFRNSLSWASDVLSTYQRDMALAESRRKFEKFLNISIRQHMAKQSGL